MQIGVIPTPLMFYFGPSALVRRRRNCSPSRAAFTLIELLTVIAIIAILAGILIPVVGRVRESAKASQCTSGLRQISMALFVYAGEHRGYLPAATIKKETSGLSGDQAWTKQIRDYLPQRGTTLTAQEHPIFICPSSDYSRDIDKISKSYTATAAIMGPDSNGTFGRMAEVSRMAESITARPRTPLIFDGKESGTSGSSQSVINWTAASADISTGSLDQMVYFDFRHSDRMNVAFADGSVRAQSVTEMQSLSQELWEGRF